MAESPHLLSAYYTPAWEIMQPLKVVICHKNPPGYGIGGGGNETHSHLARGRSTSRTTCVIFVKSERVLKKIS